MATTQLHQGREDPLLRNGAFSRALLDGTLDDIQDNAPFSRSLAKARAAARHSFDGYGAGSRGLDYDEDHIGSSRDGSGLEDGGYARWGEGMDDFREEEDMNEEAGARGGGGDGHAHASSHDGGGGSGSSKAPRSNASRPGIRRTASASAAGELPRYKRPGMNNSSILGPAPGSAGPSSRRSSRVLLIPPSPRMSSHPTPATTSYGLLGPHDEQGTPPTIMLTPASGSNSVSGTSPAASQDSRSASPVGSGGSTGRNFPPAGPTYGGQSVDDGSHTPRQRRLSNTQLDAVREELAQRRRSASLTGPAPSIPAISVTGAGASPSSRSQQSPTKSPATPMQTPGRPRRNSNVKMSAGVLAMLHRGRDKSGGPAKDPAEPSPIAQDTATPSDPRQPQTSLANSAVPSSSAATTPSTNTTAGAAAARRPIGAVAPAPVQAPTPSTSANTTRRESVSTVDSLPFGVSSLSGLPQQPLTGPAPSSTAAPPPQHPPSVGNVAVGDPKDHEGGSERPLSLPTVPKVPASLASPSPPSSSVAQPKRKMSDPISGGMVDSPTNSLKRMTISPRSGGGSGGKLKEFKEGPGSGKRVILTDFDDLSGLAHSPAHADVPVEVRDVKGKGKSHPPATEGVAAPTNLPAVPMSPPGLGSMTQPPPETLAQKAAINTILERMGLDPQSTSTRDLAAILAADGKGWLTEGGPYGAVNEGGRRRRGPMVAYDRGGREFIIDEHTLSPVTERTELSSTISSMRPMSGIHAPIAIPEANGERIGHVAGFRPGTNTTPGWAARAGLRAKLGHILNNKAAEAAVPGTPSDANEDDPAEQERLQKRMERRARVASADKTGMAGIGVPTSEGMLPVYRAGAGSPTKGPFMHRKSVATSLASSLGDAEVLHQGPLFYRAPDAVNGEGSWRRYLAVLTAEALYLSTDSNGSDYLEFSLNRCVLLRPLQPHLRSDSPVGGHRNGSESPRIRGFAMVWDDGEEETLGCRRVRERNEWIEAICKAAAESGWMIQTPELPKPKPHAPHAPHAAHHGFVNGSSNEDTSGSTRSDTSTSSLGTEFNRELAMDPPLSNSQHLYSEATNEELSRRLQTLTEPAGMMRDAGHSVGATHPGSSSPALSKEGDLFGMIERLKGMQPPGSTGAFYDKVPSEAPPRYDGPPTFDPEKTPRQESLPLEKPLKKVSPTRTAPRASSSGSAKTLRGPSALDGPAPARDLQRDLMAAQSKLGAARMANDDPSKQLMTYFDGHVQKIHGLLGDIAQKLQRGHPIGSSDSQYGEQPTIADKVDYMLSLCSILLESQHKVSTAVERTLKAQNSPLPERRRPRTASDVSRASTARSKRKVSAPVTESLDEATAEVPEPAPAEVAPVVDLHDAGLQRIEDLLGTILARMDSHQALLQAAKERKAGDSARQPSFESSLHGRGHGMGEGVRFTEPQDRFSGLTDSDVQSILNIEDDVALWKQRERGSQAKLAQDLRRLSSMQPFHLPPAPHQRVQSSEGDRASHIAEERARAARRLEGRGSPRITDIDHRVGNGIAHSPHGPSPLRPHSHPPVAPPNQQSKWSETTPRKSESPVMESLQSAHYQPTDIDRDIDHEIGARIPHGHPHNVRIDDSGPTFAPSTRPASPESREMDAHGANPHSSVMEVMMNTLAQQGEAARVGHAHQAEMTQYLGRLNQFWEVDLQKRNEDSRNLATGLSDLQNQVAVLAERIADVFTRQPPPPETHPPPNNASLDSLPSQLSAPTKAPPTDSRAQSPTLVDGDFHHYKVPPSPLAMQTFDEEPRTARKPSKLRAVKRSNSKGRKMGFAKKVPDIQAAFASVGKLWGGPTPVADRTERWGVSSPPGRRAAPTPTASKGNLRGQANHDLNKALTDLRLPKSIGQHGVQGLDVSDIMRLLREQDAEHAVTQRLEAERMDREPYLGDDMDTRRAQVEALERQREAEIARRKAKGLEDLVGVYKDHLTTNQSAMRKIVAELEASRKAEQERGAMDSQVKELERRVQDLRTEEEQMTRNVRELYNIIGKHGQGRLANRDNARQHDSAGYDREPYTPEPPNFQTPRAAYGYHFDDSEYSPPDVDRDHRYV